MCENGQRHVREHLGGPDKQPRQETRQAFVCRVAGSGRELLARIRNNRQQVVWPIPPWGRDPYRSYQSISGSESAQSVFGELPSLQQNQVRETIPDSFLQLVWKHCTLQIACKIVAARDCFQRQRLYNVAVCMATVTRRLAQFPLLTSRAKGFDACLQKRGMHSELKTSSKFPA